MFSFYPLICRLRLMLLIYFHPIEFFFFTLFSNTILLFLVVSLSNIDFKFQSCWICFHLYDLISKASIDYYVIDFVPRSISRAFPCVYSSRMLFKPYFNHDDLHVLCLPFYLSRAPFISVTYIPSSNAFKTSSAQLSI